MKVVRALLAAMILCVALDAHADYLFTWHYIFPQFQKFQGSFELMDAEMQPGAVFNSDLFRNSVEISSLDGATFTAKDPNWSDVGGHFDPQQSDPPFVMYINTHDDSHTSSLSAVAAGTPDPTGRTHSREAFLNIYRTEWLLLSTDGGAFSKFQSHR